MTTATTPQISTFSQISNSNIQEALAPYASMQARSIKELNYKVFVACQDQRILIDAWLPETIGIDLHAQYEAPFAQGLSGMAGSLGPIARFLGMSLTTQALTIQVWQGGSFIDWQIPMIFQAETSGAKDVMKPIKDLLKLTVPKDPTGGGLLEAPGPRIDLSKLVAGGVDALSTLGSAVTGATASGMIDTTKQMVSNPSSFISTVVKGANNIAQPISKAIVNSIVNNISLYIGKFIYFPSVVITDVSPVYDVLIGPDGNPQRATVNVGIRTFFMPTDQDIETMFPSATKAITG